jgi:hypothetical protein
MLTPHLPVHSVLPHRPVDPMAGLAADVPVVLLPVRVETRWFSTPDPMRLELRVRVFPDELHIAPHLAVTKGERADAATYFAMRTSQGVDAASTRQAYAQIVERAGESRASWLVRVLAPGAPAVPDAADDDRRLYVSALPHHWLAIAKAPGLRVVSTGSPIASDLPAAPHGSDDASDPNTYLGKTLAWVTDFAAAEAVGMALRMTMLSADAARLDELIVVGAPNPDADASALGDLIARHAGGGGAALVPWGTPTNVAGKRGEPAAVAPIGPTPTGDAQRTLSALGVDPAVACDIVADTVDRGAIARAMHVALWPATWGSFLSEQAAQPAATVAAARAFFVDHVRPAGPYSTLRIGAQPYGILPATSLGRWPTTVMRGALSALLTRVAASWQPAIANVPRLVDSPDIDRDLVALLRRLPSSVGGWVRQVLDGETASIMIGNVSKVQAVLHELHLQQSAAYGVPANMPIFDRVFADNVKRLGIPLVAPAAAPRDQPLSVDYLSAIAGASQLTASSVAPAPLTLLFLLARLAATRVRLSARPPETLPVRPGVLARTVPTTTAPMATATTVWTRIEDLGTVALTNSDVLEHATALRTLGRVAVGELETAFAAVVDSAAYRLDAWTTALATERLAALRTAKPHTSYVAGWAWLERPRPQTRAVENGFLHAPSMAQARTAAVLRSGYEAHRRDDNGTSLAIDLSSERVRKARWLLAGMREGRSLDRLLGDHIESWLLARDRNFDLLALRRSSVGPGAPVPDLADGWALYHEWSAERATTATLPAGVLGEAFDDLLALIDAVSDLLLADGVHNAIAGGSTARSAAALDALQRGEVATPDPRVDRTSTDGTATQRRVVLVLGDKPGWPGPSRPRAAASPRLEGLAAQILGAPGAATIMISDTVDATTSTMTKTLADLDLCALDVVALAGNGSDRSLLELAAALTPVQAGAARVTAGGPELDALVLRAAALARLFRAAHTPGAGELGDVAVSEPADRTAAVTAAFAALGQRPGAAALVGPALAADPTALATAIGSLQAAGAAAVAGVVVAGFARPAPIGSLASLTSVASATGELASWLSDVARVRPPLEPLDLLALVAPGVLPAERRTTSDAVDLVIVGSAPGAAEALVVDAWSDAAPAAMITTGVSFPYDAPRAQPPQVILVAVPPPTVPWSLGLVEAIIDETIAAARLRVVAPEDVRSQLAPTLVFTDDPHDLEPSLDLEAVAATVHVEALG